MAEQLKENEHYQLVALDDDVDSWGVRFSAGQFVETVVKFGTLQVVEEDESITYSFEIISSPDTELSEENEDLQHAVAEVLAVILEEKYASKS